MKLKLSDLVFSTKSMMDDFGRVFFMDNRVFRAIQNDKKEYCLELIKSKLFTELQEKELIPKTSITEYSIDGYDLILEHERLTETLQHEWSFNMLKSAAEMVLQVNEICSGYGYELKDAHSLNILFKGTKPLWVDIGSIAKSQSKNWIAYNEFVSSMLVPLLFWSEGKIYVTRKLLESNFHRIDVLPTELMVESDLLSILQTNIRRHNFTFSRKKIISTKNKVKWINGIKDLVNTSLNILTKRKDVQLIQYTAEYIPYAASKSILNKLVSPPVSSYWQNYHNQYYSDNGKLKPSKRMERIIELIKNTDEINSVIDLAGNQGLVCKLIRSSTKVENITLTDYDSNAIDFAFTSIKKEKINNINLLLLNFMFTRDLKDTSNRIKSDLAMALAVTHHLILSNHYSPEAIFERVKMYSKKYVMIEFMPLGLWAIDSDDKIQVPEWYNENWFKSKFENYFKIIKQEKLEDNRILFFGEII